PVDESLVHVKMNYLHPSTRKGEALKQYIPLSSYVFNTAPRKDILHSAVVYYLDGLRQGTASTKTRGEIAFSGKKILPQKGTGKARRGTRSSPLLRKGGVAHGPRPRDFSTKLNRRVRELALRSALSLRWRMGDLHVVKNLYWQPPPQSTGPLRQQLKCKGWDDALFLTAPREPRPSLKLGKTGKFSAADPIYTEEQDLEHGKEVQSFAIACGNIPRIEMINLADLTLDAHDKAKKKEDLKKPGELHAYEVLARKKLICDLGAIEWLEEKLGGSLFHE
ncbi:ribosomal protein L4, partial [Meira miltonrushii]